MYLLCITDFLYELPILAKLPTLLTLIDNWLRSNTSKLNLLHWYDLCVVTWSKNLLTLLEEVHFKRDIYKCRRQ